MTTITTQAVIVCSTDANNPVYIYIDGVRRGSLVLEDDSEPYYTGDTVTIGLGREALCSLLDDCKEISTHEILSKCETPVVSAKDICIKNNHQIVQIESLLILNLDHNGQRCLVASACDGTQFEMFVEEELKFSTEHYHCLLIDVKVQVRTNTSGQPTLHFRSSSLAQPHYDTSKLCWMSTLPTNIHTFKGPIGSVFKTSLKGAKVYKPSTSRTLQCASGHWNKAGIDGELCSRCLVFPLKASWSSILYHGPFGSPAITISSTVLDSILGDAAKPIACELPPDVRISIALESAKEGIFELKPPTRLKNGKCTRNFELISVVW